LAGLLNAMAQSVPETEPVATGVVWSDSGVLTLSVGIPPVITIQPQSQLVEIGDEVTFTIAATGADSYQWRRDGIVLTGETGTSYVIASVDELDSGAEIDCVVTGVGGSTTSDTAAITIRQLLLDAYTGSVAAAYSVRKLRKEYAGAALRVRRSSDNAEQDIGFVADELDTETLLSFVGASNGFVLVWYDQRSGPPRNATGDSGTQPVIVLSGVLQTFEGKPAIRWDSAGRWLSVDGGVLRNVPGMMLSDVCSFSSISTSSAFAATTNSSPSARLVLGTETSGWVLGARRLDGDSFATITGSGLATNAPYHHVAVVDFATTSGKLWVNSALKATSSSFLSNGNTSDTDSEAVRIGARGDNATPMQGFRSELIIGDSAPGEEDRQILQDLTELYYFGEVL
jgi:hypothetical protein